MDVRSQGNCQGPAPSVETLGTVDALSTPEERDHTQVLLESAICEALRAKPSDPNDIQHQDRSVEMKATIDRDFTQTILQLSIHPSPILNTTHAVVTWAIVGWRMVQAKATRATHTVQRIVERSCQLIKRG